VVLAVLAGIATGAAERQTDSLLVPALLLITFGVAVGGLAPRAWWWLGLIAGLGVPMVRLATSAGTWASSEMGRRSLELFGSEWVGLLAPVAVAVACSGLGANLQRWTGAGHDG